MAYSIYGEPLARGHCEVHPDVPEIYPCSYCLEEYQQHQLEQDEANEYYRWLAEEHDKIMAHIFWSCHIGDPELHPMEEIAGAD